MNFFRKKLDEFLAVAEFHPILCSIVVVASMFVLIAYDKIMLGLINFQIFDYFVFREQLANHLIFVQSLYFILPFSCMYIGYCYTRRLFYSKF